MSEERLQKVEDVLEGTFSTGTWVVRSSGAEASFINLLTGEERKIPPSTSYYAVGKAVWNYTARVIISGGIMLRDVNGRTRELKVGRVVDYIALTYPHLVYLTEEGDLGLQGSRGPLDLKVLNVDTNLEVVSLRLVIPTIGTYPKFSNHLLTLEYDNRVLVWREETLLRGENPLIIQSPHGLQFPQVLILGGDKFGFWYQKVLVVYNSEGVEERRLNFMQNLLTRFREPQDVRGSPVYLPLQDHLLVPAHRNGFAGYMTWDFKRGRFVGKFLDWKKGIRNVPRTFPSASYIPSLNSLLLGTDSKSYLLNLETRKVEEVGNLGYYPFLLQEDPVVIRILRCVLTSRLGRKLPRDLLREVMNFF